MTTIDTAAPFALIAETLLPRRLAAPPPPRHPMLDFTRPAKPAAPAVAICPPPPPTMKTSEAFAILNGFMPGAELRTLADNCRGEEGDYFRQLVAEYATRIKKMPTTYQQAELGDQAIVYLHYFTGNCDWHITEKDIDHDNEGQLQAFGLANLGDGPELGYISIAEIIANGGELDLHWKPITLAAVRAKEA